MDAERLREGLDELLKSVDYVVCAAQFPQASALFCLEFMYCKKCYILGLSHQLCFLYVEMNWI